MSKPHKNREDKMPTEKEDVTLYFFFSRGITNAEGDNHFS